MLDNAHSNKYCAKNRRSSGRVLLIRVDALRSVRANDANIVGSKMLIGANAAADNANGAGRAVGSL